MTAAKRQIVFYIPFHRWEVTRGGKWKGLMESPEWWQGRLPMFRDWCVRSLRAQTDQRFDIVVTMRDQDATDKNNPIIKVLPELGCNRLVRPYMPWQYHIAPNQADYFSILYRGCEWLVIITLDSDDCYQRETVEYVRQLDISEGMCGYFAYGYKYSVLDHKMCWYGSAGSPPPFFLHVYTREALTSAKAFAAYRKHWKFDSYHHKMSRTRNPRRLRDGMFLQTIHGANTENKWSNKAVQRKIEHWISGDDKKAEVLRSFGQEGIEDG